LFGENTDQTWRDLAREDPYFAVLTTEGTRGAGEDPERKTAFMRTGEEFADLVFAVWPELQQIDRSRVVDFGCGVGRLLIPFARRFDEAVGVDVSDVMLAEARANAAAAGVNNLRLVADVAETGPADLVHSQIVLQHIPVARGLELIAGMWRQVRPGGVLAIQFPIAADLSTTGRIYKALTSAAPWLRPAINLLRGKPPNADRMQMNVYPLNDIVQMLHLNGGNRITLVGWPSDPWHQGVYLLARREREA
jgi:trans-aconitate methyltransferase